MVRALQLQVNQLRYGLRRLEEQIEAGLLHFRRLQSAPGSNWGIFAAILSKLCHIRALGSFCHTLENMDHPPIRWQAIFKDVQFWVPFIVLLVGLALLRLVA